MEDTSTAVYVDRRPPAAKDNTTRFLSAGAVTLLALLTMGLVFWAMVEVGGSNDEPPLASDAVPPTAEPAPAQTQPAPEPTSEPSAEPTSVAAEPTEPAPPPAPASNELVSQPWVLDTFAVNRPNGELVVNGTVKNVGGAAGSATIRVYVYVADVLIGTAKGDVVGVPPGGTVEVALPSGAPWAAGPKTVLMTATEIPQEP